MRQFIKRCFLFFIVFLCISLIIRTLLPKNFYWGNDEYANKIHAYKKENTKKYNTVFFGSSRILTGLDPAIFDSLINLNSGKKVNSFNLASPGTWFNETYYLYDKFLDDPGLHANIDLVLMEFQNVMSIAWEKISTDKVIYYQNAGNLKFIANYSLHENDGMAKKTFKSLHYMSSYSIAYIENLLNVGKSDLLFPSAKKKDTIENRGYKKLRYNAHLVSEAEIKKYIENTDNYLHIEQHGFNRSYHYKIMEMISRSKEKGIKLIFILPPVHLTNSMMGVYKSIPDSNKIEICDSKKYSELYQLHHWSDQTHFNNIGAEIFTRYVVNKIIPLSYSRAKSS